MSIMINIEECAGYSITLMVESGKFVALCDGQSSGIESGDLNDLRKRLRVLAEKERRVERQNYLPVKVWVYAKCKSQQGGFLVCVDVVGVVAGHRYETVLRALQGQIVPMNSPMVVFHCDDMRVADFGALLERARDLQEKLTINTSAIRKYVAASPHVNAPIARTKEDAFDVEPQFLQALRDIHCEHSLGVERIGT